MVQDDISSKTIRIWLRNAVHKLVTTQNRLIIPKTCLYPMYRQHYWIGNHTVNSVSNWSTYCFGRVRQYLPNYGCTKCTLQIPVSYRDYCSVHKLKGILGNQGKEKGWVHWSSSLLSFNSKLFAAFRNYGFIRWHARITSIVYMQWCLPLISVFRYNQR